MPDSPQASLTAAAAGDTSLRDLVNNVTTRKAQSTGLGPTGETLPARVQPGKDLGPRPSSSG